MPIISFKHVSKSFRIPEPSQGFWKSLARKEKLVHALNDVTFEVKEGEILGYIGPNGAGKSTTIKILTGILVPDKGEVGVNDFTPWKERERYTFDIGVVFGHKSLLWWDIAPLYSFRLYKSIYEMTETEYQDRLKYLVDLFDVQEFMHIPTRKLSLGQRMRCELVASLIHKPKILFLDEPTIGLDVVAKQRMREAILAINQKEKTTVILTTHDMGDIEQLAHRIIVLDKGKIIHEGDVHSLRKTLLIENEIQFEIEKIINEKEFQRLCRLYGVELKERSYILKFDANHSAKLILDSFYSCARISTFEVRHPSLEVVIRDFYSRKNTKKR
ncbi:MAG: ATP-binding cassette domain-containing protein [Candidatus Diapherotrites archaeon]|nr:ATP-binding cassette domain-containing protein [Candidatus Diapherotrites archaeon]